jgi:predicted transcriptional regulator
LHDTLRISKQEEITLIVHFNKKHRAGKIYFIYFFTPNAIAEQLQNNCRTIAEQLQNNIAQNVNHKPTKKAKTRLGFLSVLR